MWHGRILEAMRNGAADPFLASCYFKKDSSPPDYTPMAQASAESAKLGAELGGKQLDEAKRQYDANMTVAKPIIDAQAALTQQQIAQGNEYAAYAKQSRPAEQAMMAQAFGVTGADTAKYNELRAAAAAKGQQTWQAQQSQNVSGIDAQIAQLQAKQDAEYAKVQQSQATAQTMQAAREQAAREQAATARGRMNEWGVYENNGQPAEPAPAAAPDNLYKAVDYSAQLKALQDSKLAATGQKFDPSTVDQTEADAYSQQAMMSGLQGIEARDAAERGNIQALTEADDATMYERGKGDIEYGVGNAIADTRTGYSSAINQAIRQGLRYGYSPSRLASMASGTALGNASQQASAANAARTQGITNYRGKMLAGANTGRSMGQQDKAIQWGKQLDAIGLSKGMVGASQGAYSLANQAGNSAVANQTGTGNAYMSAMGQGIGTQMQGQQMKQQGLSSVLNNQSANFSPQQDNTGAALGAVGGIASAVII